jgi:60 kDa SS-A/Ro ribonucleoprotein
MKFNFSLRGRPSADTRYTLVKAGVPDAHEDLYRSLLAASLADDLAGQPPEEVLASRKEIRASDPDLIARLAIYFGEEKDFRETAFWLTAELAVVSGNEENTGLLVERIVRQAIDIPLWLGYFARAAGAGEKPGRAVQKYLARLFHRLDEYSFARYSRETQTALRDALRLLRPKAADRAKKNLFARILRDQIPVRSTWEREWHALHHQHYDSPEQRQVTLRDKWKEGISSFRIGYTALLDNLRPMLCAGVSGKVLKLAAEYLGNAAAVGRSGTSPLRLLEVYQSLHRMEQGGAGMLAEALEKAVLHSNWTRGTFGSKGISVIAMDVSNSMKRPVYPGGGALRFDIAPLLAGLWRNRDYSLVTGIIGNTWKLLETSPRLMLATADAHLMPAAADARPVLATADEFRGREGEAGYALNAHLILQDLLRKKQAVARVLIFTDCRLWDNRTFNQPAGTDLGDWWRQYRREVAPQAKLYLFDLAGYGAKPLDCREDDVFLVAGWRTGIFDVLDAVEKGKE